MSGDPFVLTPPPDVPALVEAACVTREADDAERRAEFIRGLRDLADFLDQHPNVDAPRYCDLNVFVNTREDLARHARAGSWEKIFNDTWFYLRKSFGRDLTLDITTGRETVCRRVVTGKRLVEAQPERLVDEVEWICEEASLLNGGAR